MSHTTRLVESLKLLRKADGLTLGSIAMLPDVGDVFGTDDCRAIRDAITEAIATEADDKCVAALSNAYGINTDAGPNLMDRRRAYAKSHRMAMRTLTNYEEFGAIIVAQLLSLPVQSSASWVDVYIDVIEDMSLGALQRDDPLDNDRRTAVLAKLIALEKASDTEIEPRHSERLAEIIHKVKAADEASRDASSSAAPVAPPPLDPAQARR